MKTPSPPPIPPTPHPLIDSAKLMYIEVSFVSTQQAAHFSSRLLNLFWNNYLLTTVFLDMLNIVFQQ